MPVDEPLAKGTKSRRRQGRSVEAAAEYHPCCKRVTPRGPDPKPGAPAEYRRRSWSGKGWALRRLAQGFLVSQPTAHVATLRPNPSLERRPHEACYLCAAQGSRRLHCPARRKGSPPRGSPQLER